MPKLKCDIVTPASRLHSEDAYMVVVPGAEGEMGFLPDHEPLVSVLADGIVRIQPEKDGEMIRYVSQGGYVEVTGAKVIVLADRACPVAAVDPASVRELLDGAEAELAALSQEEADKTTLAADIAWYKMQLHAVEG